MQVYSFNIENANEYKEIERKYFRYFGGELPAYNMSKCETIYLLFIKSRVFKRNKLIGRCIVGNITEISKKKHLDFFSSLHNIPRNVLEHYPTVIEDFFIMKPYRRRGYGRRFLDVILNEINGSPISLYAQDDGLEFWKRLGFKNIGGSIFTCDNSLSSK